MQESQEIKEGSLVKHLRIGFVGIAKDICTDTNSARVEILDNIIVKGKNEDFKYYKERHVLGQLYTALLNNLEVVKTTLTEDVEDEDEEDVEDAGEEEGESDSIGVGDVVRHMEYGFEGRVVEVSGVVVTIDIEVGEHPHVKGGGTCVAYSSDLVKVDNLKKERNTPAVTVITKDSTTIFSKYKDFEKYKKTFQLP